MNKIGLIAGDRDLPLLFAAQVKKHAPESELTVIALRGETKKQIASFADKIYWITPGRISESIKILKKEGVTDLIMLGQVSPVRIFMSRRGWDDLTKKIVSTINDFRPHSVFKEIIATYESFGFNFLSTLTYMKDNLVLEGANNNVIVSDADRYAIEQSLSIAEDIVELDIGQTVVFKNKAVVAVEALEGTDECIRRAGRICGRGFIVVKRARKEQDVRFDVPVVGIKTISLLKRLKAKALVLHAQKTIILDKQKVLETADKAGIAVVGYL